ncbi:hypothetical protein [Desulfuromonas thiophila]|uniref:Uncharacterized protein n=1 Tax=Desulfuromonas thiophila TaxID=57664 RepID=A0A1G7ESI0_9BACT|nr:hypothetical protein [Desulfuromonas thiophila]SDE66618.1 hypothetical protein SAMN05661003_1239 [Desulfuromonas thiophila]
MPRVAYVFFTLVLLYMVFMVPFGRQLQQRPSLVKLGYVPQASVVRLFAADQRLTVAAFYSLRALIYYGDMIRQWRAGNRQTPEMENLFGFLESSVHLDPYNMDTLYFLQAAFTWEVNRAEDVNRLLAYAMNFRYWDWLLPYYAGFNAGYFLQEPAAAATYMERAADLSGHPLLANLAARYLQQSGKAALALAFLDDMIGRDRARYLDSALMVRRQALQAMVRIEQAVEHYRGLFGHDPKTLERLVDAGLLAEVPADPYGGRFFLDATGRVQTTSRLAFSREQQK